MFRFLKRKEIIHKIKTQMMLFSTRDVLGKKNSFFTPFICYWSTCLLPRVWGKLFLKSSLVPPISLSGVIDIVSYSAFQLRKKVPKEMVLHRLGHIKGVHKVAVVHKQRGSK